MSPVQSSPRRSRTGSAFGTAMVAVGVLVAVAVAVMMLALTTAYRSSAGSHLPDHAHPTAAQTEQT